jgi:hypothetical protein
MPVLGLLFLIAVGYAMREGYREMRKGSPGARPAGKRRGETPAQARVRRTQQSGYWAHQLLNGLPAFRHGARRGWRASQQATHNGRTEGIEGRASLSAQLADHKRRRAEALRLIETSLHPEPASQPPPGDDLPAEHLAPSKPASQPAASQNGHDPMACKDPGCACHKQPAASPASAPAGRGPSRNGAAPVSDLNYPMAVDKADALMTAADMGVNDELVNQATMMADELGAMVPTDGDTQGKAADVATAAAAVVAAHKQLADASAALKDRLVTTYGPTHEDVQASGEQAAEPAFHNA